MNSASSPSSPLWQLILTRWRGFLREPGAIFWSFGFPLLLSLALGVAFRDQPPAPVEVGVVNGAGADELLAALSAANDKSAPVSAHRVAPDQADLVLRSGKVALLVMPSPRSYRFDPLRPDARMARLVVDDILQRAAGRADRFHADDLTATARGSRYIDFLIPGMLGMGLMQGGLWAIGFVLVELRTQKLIKRLVATPMRRAHFLLSFVLSRGLFLAAELPILLGFARLVFGVPIRGSLLLVVALAALGSLVFAGLGLLCASRAQNTQTVSGLINLVSLPMFVLSGVFFSSARFPAVLQPFIAWLPLSALNDALRAVMLEGAGAVAVLHSVLVLVVWGVVSFVVALRLFRWS